MKIKSEFILKNTAGTWIAMAVGSEYMNVDGVLTLNDSGALLWKALEQGCELDDLIRILTEQYEIDANQATEDANAFVEKLRNFDCLV